MAACLQISIGGGAFTDILAAGGSFVTGGYIEAITDQGDVAGQASPLKGQQGLERALPTVS